MKSVPRINWATMVTGAVFFALILTVYSVSKENVRQDNRSLRPEGNLL